jgi:hypothetical protein
MALMYNPAVKIFQGKNIRPPLGSITNGKAYELTLYPELGKPKRSVLIVKMTLQFQFKKGEGGEWTQGEKDAFAHRWVDTMKEIWSEKYRITANSSAMPQDCLDVGVVFDFPYFIDGWHTSDDYEITVVKQPADKAWVVSSCGYTVGNTTLDSNDFRGEGKGATMPQRDAVHEFGHMLGLRDEYPSARDPALSHTGDVDSIMNAGEIVRERHYAPFAQWLTEQWAIENRKQGVCPPGSRADYKVEGKINMSNALL